MRAYRLVVFGLVLALASAGVAWGTCSFCGSSGYGTCPYGRVHKHTDCGGEKCMYCGSSGYGTCSQAPHGKHEHGFGQGKCRFCGSSSFGSCGYSPSGIHEH